MNRQEMVKDENLNLCRILQQRSDHLNLNAEAYCGVLFGAGDPISRAPFAREVGAAPSTSLISLYFRSPATGVATGFLSKNCR